MVVTMWQAAWLRMRPVASAVVFVAAACQPAAVPDRGGSRPAARPATAPASPTAPSGADSLASPSLGPAVVPPAARADGAPVSATLRRVRQPVDWTAAANHPPLAATLTPSQRRMLRRATLPVLVPDRHAALDVAVATADVDWYTLSASWDGITLVVQGDRVATLDPDLAPAGWVAPTWSQPLVTRNEGIVEATFLAYGASYVVSLECAQPLQDPRCTEDAAVLDWLATLHRWQATRGAP